MTTSHRLLGAALLGAATLWLPACGGGTDAPAQPSLTPPASTCSAAGVAASSAPEGAGYAHAACVLTSQGEFVVGLDAAAAPLTVANFRAYVNEGFFDLTTFHRVIPGFVAQGGGKAVDAAYGTSWKTPTHGAVHLESDNGLRNLRGTIAMARLPDPTYDSATSQFFVNLVDNPFLDYVFKPDALGNPIPNGYAVFGKVLSGMDTLDRIAALPTVAEEPRRPVVIVYWAQELR
jgi:peptidyl-prolyl cis-trans isomerase A (cyclophilin A)